MRRLRTLFVTILAATAALPALPAQAYAPFDTTSTTIQHQGNVGSRSAAALMPGGLPLIASWDRTNNEIDVIACANAECSEGESHTVLDNAYWGSFDIALGSDGRPVVAASTGFGVAVIKCGDLACSSGNTTTSIASGDWYSAFYGVSIDVNSSNHPRVAYSSSRWGAHQLHVVSCNDAGCTGGDEHDRYLSGSTVGYYSDLVVDAGDRAALAWSEGSDAFLTRCEQTCASSSTESIGTGMQDPSIAASGDRLSIVGRTGFNRLNTVDCAPQCGAPTAVMAWNDRGYKADIAFVGDDHTVIAFIEPSLGYLEFIDCPNTCLAPQYVDRGVNPSGASLSIAGGDGEAYVSHARGRADLGLSHIFRPSKPGIGLGK